MTGKKFHLGTTALHAGQVPDQTTGSQVVPLYQTSSYVFKNTEHAANHFGHITSDAISVLIGRGSA